jgi:hypothetical protein
MPVTEASVALPWYFGRATSFISLAELAQLRRFEHFEDLIISI